MTEELEQKAEEKYCKNCKLRQEQCLWAWRKTNGLDMPNNQNCSCKEVPAYIAGATENGIVWHDLRKDPKDLPNDDRDVINERGMIVWCKEGIWYEGDVVMKIRAYPIAWCEIPQFKE